METMTDEKGNIHSLKKLIGEDGQGKLYNTGNKGIILRDAREHENDRTIYNDVKLLPLEDITNIILPGHHLLETGYVVTIPEGYSPLTGIMPADEEDATKFYVETGGLKRRLAVLTELAKTLIKLHSLPCMYGSISPARIFISNEERGVFLLYSVKMTSTMPLTRDGDDEPYTAPEARAGLASLLSDVFSFGALAQDLLTHKGICPLPDTMDELTSLLGQAQSMTLAERPKLVHIYRLLCRQLDSLLTCQGCGADYHYTAPACPFCEGKPTKAIKATIYDQINETRIDRGVKIFEFSTTRQALFNHHTDLSLFGDEIEPRIECLINISDKKLHFILKNIMSKDIVVNDEVLPHEHAMAVPLPVPIIRVEFKLFATTTRKIDLVII